MAAEDDLTIARVHALFVEERAGGMSGRHGECGRDRTLLLPQAHKRAVGAGAGREAKTVKQDGLAGPRFTGQNRKTCRKRQVQLIDQNNVTNAETGQHRAPLD